ncbi:MAG TPA: TSUP family transporter, partial [Ureibacillus sp.]|nr:TSUP family transporter [Ureibacillus sp.]
RKPLNWKRGALFVASLLLIGFYDGFFGPGTGSFVMFVFLIAGFDFLQAAGNAKLLNFASNIAALIMFLILGEVVFVYGLIMGISMIAGAYIGTKFALSKGTSFVRMLFIIMTVVLIIKNIYDYVAA